LSVVRKIGKQESRGKKEEGKRKRDISVGAGFTNHNCLSINNLINPPPLGR
jgi:hypothetical protein